VFEHGDELSAEAGELDSLTTPAGGGRVALGPGRCCPCSGDGRHLFEGEER
jgi:hypothetical protein